MPFPASGLLPSSLLYPLDAGIDFIGFSKDFKRLLDRYGRTLKNHRTNTLFPAILNILNSTRCLADGKQMQCGDAIAYALPSLMYKIGDHISPTSGRGEWIIVAEKYASRIGDLRIFRTIGLERYTPNATLEGLYTIVAPMTTEIESLYNITEKLVQIIGLRVEPDLVNNILSYWNAEEDDTLSYYKVHRDISSGFSPSDDNLVGTPRTNSFAHNDLEYAKTYYFKVCAVTKLGTSGAYSSEISAITSALIISSELRGVYDISAEVTVDVELGGLYNMTQELTALTLLCRYDITALDVPGIVLAGRYDLMQELVSLGLESKYDIIALEGLYPSTILYPSTSLYPRGPGRVADIMSAEFTGLYDITKELVSLEMLSRYDVNALDVPGIVLAGSYDLTEELVSLEMVGVYEIKSKDIAKEMVSSYDITKTPAQIAGERAVATGNIIDTYWNPWNDEDLSYYKVHRSLNNAFVPSDANLVGVPTTNGFKHNDLAAITQYYFKVCAVTKLGASGTYSAQFTATTA